jgi:hypothetical protein
MRKAAIRFKSPKDGFVRTAVICNASRRAQVDAHAANGGNEPRLPDCRIAAKVRFPEVKTFVPVNTSDTEPCPIGSLLQCGFPKADIAKRRRVYLMLNKSILLNFVLLCHLQFTVMLEKMSRPSLRSLEWPLLPDCVLRLRMLRPPDRGINTNTCKFGLQKSQLDRTARTARSCHA